MKRLALWTVVLIVVSGALVGGCSRKSSRPQNRGQVETPDNRAAMADELLMHALADLNDVERFEGGETVYQAIDRLDQWVQSQPPLVDWKIDPLAAPVITAMAQFAKALEPIDQQLASRRDQFELKGIARVLQHLPEGLEAVGRKRSLEDLEGLGRQFEAFTRQLEGMAKRLNDVNREAVDNSRILEEFDKRVKSAEKQTRVRELVGVAQQLDDPSRLQELTRFRDFVRQLDALAQRDPKQLADVAGRFEEISGRVLRGAQTRLVLEVQFVLAQLSDLDRLHGLLALREVSNALDRAAERLKGAAVRTEREDVRELAARLAAAGKKRDLEQLKALKGELEALAKPRDLGELRTLLAQVIEPAQQLQRLSQQIAEEGRKLELKNLADLSRVCDNLGKQLQELAEVAGKLRPSTPPETLDKQLDAVLGGYDQLAARVEMLHNELRYLASVDQLAFPRPDVMAFQEAVWLRDVAKWARGEEADELRRAKRLFDWTVRNIQLYGEITAGQAKTTRRPLQSPWETLLVGRGTPWDRAWVFILLARQQGIDAALLAVRDSDGVRPWAVAALIEGQLYLFDPSLGLPIPAKNGANRGESAALEIQPATLAQAAADDSLLRQLDTPQARYPFTAAQIQNVVALVEASPAYLGQRMRMVESRLTGDSRLVLTASASTEAQRLKACRHVAEVRLWTMPYETVLERVWLGPESAQFRQAMLAPFAAPSLAEGRSVRKYVDETDAPLLWERQRELLTNPQGVQKQRQRERSYAERREDVPPSPLWKGRVRHLKGALTGEKSAVSFYQLASPSDNDIQAAPLEPQYKQVFVQAKQNASYWLGLVAFEQGNFSSAQHHLRVRTVQASPGGPWTAGAKYNLARALEAEGKYAEALRQYVANANLPDGAGNRLRAQWLAAAARLPVPEPESPTAGKPPAKLDELPGLGPAKKAEPKPPATPDPKPPATPQSKPLPAKAPDLPGLEPLPAKK